MTALKLLDLEGVNERLDYEYKLVVELAQHFVERSGGQLSQVDTAIRGSDPKALEYAAHLFKSSLAIFGADAAVIVAQALEDLGHMGKIDGAASLVLELAALTDQLKHEIITVILGQKL